MPALVCNILSVPPAKTGSNGLPPPDEPRSGFSCVGVGLGVVVDGIVVVLSASVGVALKIGVSLSVGVLPIVVELSLLSVVDVVIADELSAVLVVSVDVS